MTTIIGIGPLIFIVLFFIVFIFSIIIGLYSQYKTMQLHGKTLAYNMKNPNNSISFAGTGNGHVRIRV